MNKIEITAEIKKMRFFEASPGCLFKLSRKGLRTYTKISSDSFKKILSEKDTITEKFKIDPYAIIFVIRIAGG